MHKNHCSMPREVRNIKPNHHRRSPNPSIIRDLCVNFNYRSATIDPNPGGQVPATCSCNASRDRQICIASHESENIYSAAFEARLDWVPHLVASAAVSVKERTLFRLRHLGSPTQEPSDDYKIPSNNLMCICRH